MIAKIKKRKKNINIYIIIHSCEMSCSFLCTLEANKKKGTHKNNKKENREKENREKKSLNANSIKID